MLEILVFKNKGKSAITTDLQSFSSNHLVKEKRFTERDTGEDYSKLQCIVMGFHADEIANADEECIKLSEFLINNRINPNIPIIPIVYEAESEYQQFLQKNLNSIIKKHQALNLLESGLIRYKSESTEVFKNKLREAKFSSGFTVVPTYTVDDSDLSGKNFDITLTIVITLLIIAGVILGPIIGGIVAGVVLAGGVGFGFLGAGIGLFAGPALGYLIGKGIEAITSTNVAENRGVDLQQKRELDQKNEQWSIFKASFFQEDSPALIGRLLQTNDTKPTSEPTTQVDAQAAVAPKKDSKDKRETQFENSEFQDDGQKQTAFGM